MEQKSRPRKNAGESGRHREDDRGGPGMGRHQRLDAPRRSPLGPSPKAQPIIIPTGPDPGPNGPDRLLH